MILSRAQILLSSIRRTPLHKIHRSYYEEKFNIGFEKSVNSVTLMGRVGADAKKQGSDEKPVATFSLATNTTNTKNPDGEKKTEWHRIAVFKQPLCDNTLEKVKKGDRVFVTGYVSYAFLTTPYNEKKSYTNIIADDVILISHGKQFE